MKSLIRWQGLLAFVVVVSLLAAISIVFLDTWIKIAAEKGLGQSNGAEVNIESVEHSFSPFGATLYGLQITDPDAPKTNRLEAGSVAANIDLAPLLLRKLIIDDLKISGVQFSTARGSEGAVYRSSQTEEDEQSTPFSDVVGVPSVEEILAKSPLKTTRAAEDLEASYAKHIGTLEAQYASLPKKEKLAKYQARIKELTETDYQDPGKLLAAKEEFDALKAELKQDKQQFEQFKTALQQAKADIEPNIDALKQAPSQDYNQLKSLLTGDADAIEDVTTLVFGEQIGQWSRYALAAFDIAGPMLKTQSEVAEEASMYQGQWISFDDNSGLPDLLIKQAEVSLQWQGENISSFWTDITHQHDVLGRATTFFVDSSAGQLWQSLKLNGDLWLTESNGAKGKQSWSLAGLKLADIGLIEQEKLDGKLDSGLLFSSGDISLNGDKLSGNALVDLQQLIIQATGNNKITSIVADTLNQLTELKLNTDIGGVLGALDLSISSDLNQQIGSALVANVTSEQQAKLDELKQKLNQQTQGVLGDSQTQYAEILNWQELTDGNLTSINTMLKSQLNSLVDKEKDKLKGKLLDKILG